MGLTIACLFFGLELAQCHLPIRIHGFQTVGKAGGETAHWRERPAPPRQIHTLSPQEEKRVRVEWGKIEVWKGSDAGLVIHGKLFIESVDGKSRQPLGFAPGVGVVLGRTSKDRPNWSKNYDEKDSVWSYRSTEADGSFDANIWLYDLIRTVGKTNSFQIGITLGKTDWFRSVRFSNASQVLPQTIGTIAIAGPQPINRTMQFINGAPRVRFYGYDPVRLVQAVNHLQSLGKTKAIQAMRDYLKLVGSRHNRRCDPDPANLDDGHQDTLYVIIPLLFEQANKTDAEAAKELWYAMLAKPWSNEEKSWPQYPFAMQDDIPFLIGNETTGWEGGGPPYPDKLIDWAEKHGKLRAKRIRPADNPLLAAESLVALNKPLPQFSGRKTETELRMQAWRAVRHLIANELPKEDRMSYSDLDIDKEWPRYKKLTAELNIRWDEKQRQYVADGAASRH
jgi:hypothetical protein